MADRPAASIRALAERYASDPEFKREADEAMGVYHIPAHPKGECRGCDGAREKGLIGLDYQTGWRAWIVDRLLAVAVWAARSATRLDSRQEFGVWERRKPSGCVCAEINTRHCRVHGQGEPRGSRRLP